jgi:hypothetical protein
VHRLAKHLHGRNVTVMTSNLAVYEELATDSAVEIILLGGVVRRNYLSMVGFLTEQALRQVHATTLFFGTSGIRADGTVLDTTVVEVPRQAGHARRGGPGGSPGRPRQVSRQRTGSCVRTRAGPTCSSPATAPTRVRWPPSPTRAARC